MLTEESLLSKPQLNWIQKSGTSSSDPLASRHAARLCRARCSRHRQDPPTSHVDGVRPGKHDQRARPNPMFTPGKKDAFYEALDEMISGIPNSEAVYLLEDFNARVGADHGVWPSCLGVHGRGKTNDNGQRLLELCCFHGFHVMNTFLKCKDIHQVSWRHPRSHHWHQLDLIITRHAELSSVLPTRTNHSADCDTDHSLVACKVRVTPKKNHHGKRGCPRINICCVSNQERTQQYISQIEETLADTTDQSSDLKWARKRDAMYTSAITVYGKKEHKNADWCEAHWEEMEPVTEEKRKALLAYKAAPGPSTTAVLRAARKKSQQTTRHCANTYWLNLCNSIQRAVDFGDARGMYVDIK